MAAKLERRKKRAQGSQAVACTRPARLRLGAETSAEDRAVLESSNMGFIRTQLQSTTATSYSELRIRVHGFFHRVFGLSM